MASEEQELDGNGSSPEIVDGLEPSTEINNETDINPECLPCDTTDTDEMTSTSEQNGESDESCAIESSWGFSLEELFGMALKFFKEMDGKAFHPAYEEKLRLVALHKQVSVGPYNPGACSEIGFFDVLGNDRRKEWIRLGSMAKEDAMEDFVKLLNSCCHLFAAYVTSHKIEKEEQERRRREEEERLRLEMEEEERRHREEEQRREKEEQERKKKEEEKRKREEGEKLQIEEQKQKIMAVLNAQTAVHFQQYAAQQYPDNPKQQQALTQMLQEKHYQQFMQQAYSQQQQALQRQQEGSVESSQPEALFPHSSDMANPNGQAHHDSRTQEDGLEPPLSDDHIRDMHYGTGEVSMGISSPSMWTRPQIGDFKEKMRRDVDSVVTVGRGEVLTISVPTNENGSFLFWEFATDHCDIGFGLFFKWTDTLDDKVIGPYADEDAGDGTTQQEVEKAREVEEVVPVFRRDSHQEVYAGSHRYPGHGVYLLKFDNSYSLWRSKVVYYRVYYTR